MKTETAGRSLGGALCFFSIATIFFANEARAYDPRYLAAVAEASENLTDEDISYNLTTIGTDDHIRNDDGQLLMTMFTGYVNSGTIGYTRVNSSTAWHPKLWVTVAPEVQSFLTTNNVAPADVNMRTRQLLGLADTAGTTNWAEPYYIVEFWTNNSALFRPAMDCDITHGTTSLEFVGEMTSSTNTKRIWFDNNKNSTYTSDPPFPWTRAGYTYDWANTETNRGKTEFILNNENCGTTDILAVRSVISVTSYLYYDRTTESFDVTDSCDTLWMGSAYLPVTAGGNTVAIHSGVTISDGQGISVTDLSSGTVPSSVHIYNAGTILGASSSGTATGLSSMHFVNTGGTLSNTGTITGDDTGVLGGTTTRSIAVLNSGTIRGTSYAIKTAGGADAITNSGLIDGNISTGDGDDVINVLGGSITGEISGGSGTNTMNFDLTSGSMFTFNGNILEMSDLNVNSGTVRLNGGVEGAATVAAGAIFGGSCTMQNSLVNSGAVAPGNSIGTMTVLGNYTQNAGAKLSIEVAKSSGGTVASDLLFVGGTASLAPGSTIEILCDASSTGVFATGDDFMVISAASLSNNAGLSLDSIFLSASGDQIGNDYVVTLNRSATFASAANTRNNSAMAAALDADAAAGVTGTHAALINQLMFTNSGSFNDSLHLLSPAAYLSVGAACDRTTQYMAESTGGYLRNRRAGMVNIGQTRTVPAIDADSAFARAVGSPTELAGIVKYCGSERTLLSQMESSDMARSVWVNPFGVFYGEKTAGDHLGFQSNAAGVQVGIDEQYGENFIFGVGAGYDLMHYAGGDGASAGSVNTLRIGPYATWFDGCYYLDSSLTGGFHANKIGRAAAVNDQTYSMAGDYKANDLSLYLGGGRDYCMGPYTVSPLLSMQYIYYRQNQFTETGDEAAALTVAARDAHSLRSRVGSTLRREYQWETTRIVPELLAGWAHEYLADEQLESQFIGGISRFSIDRGGVFRDAGFYGLNLIVQRRENVSFFTSYTGEYSIGGHFAAVDMGMVLRF